MPVLPLLVAMPLPKLLNPNQGDFAQELYQASGERGWNFPLWKPEQKSLALQFQAK